MKKRSSHSNLQIVEVIKKSLLITTETYKRNKI